MKGLNDIKKMLKNKGVELSRKSDKAVKTAGMAGVVVAKRKAPIKIGKLRQGINGEHKYLKFKISSQMPYSVYVEFGTGLKTDMSDTPPEMKEIAQMYKDGGDPGGNRNPQPFMRPAYKVAKGVLKIELSQL